MPDERALKILFDTYWCCTGWKSAGKPSWIPHTPPDDYNFALQAGAMFPPTKITHQVALERIGELRARISPLRVGSAFLDSLSSSRVGLRSELGSYAVALHMPLHQYAPSPGTRRCQTCGEYETGNEDVNVLNFERHKWGGVRHEQPAYIAFDLERFTSEAMKVPAVYDHQLLTRLLATLESIGTGAKLSDLVRALKPVLPGNEAQRRTVVSILGYAGVLRVPDRPAFFRSFTLAVDREETPWYKDDWPYPIRWWRGGDGIDEQEFSSGLGNSDPPSNHSIQRTRQKARR